MRMRNRRPDPMLMGVPSPSLSKMNRMNRADLAVQIERLTTEAARLAAKIENLKAHKPCPEDRLKSLTEQLERLHALEKAARERLMAKELHKTQHDQRFRRPR